MTFNPAIVGESHLLTAKERIAYDNERVSNLWHMIQGRLTFPDLFIQVRWMPVREDLTCCETGECAGWGGH